MKAEPRTSQYVVFATTEEPGSADISYIEVGTYKVEGNGGQRLARRAAMEDPSNADLKRIVLDGGTVTLFCVPRQSFVPHPVRLDAPKEPKVVY